MSTLASKSREPIYKKLKDTIKKEIENKTLKEGDVILSERLLGEKFKISRISVRKAISELIEENYLYTVPGKGTFVKGLKSDVKKERKKTFNLGYIFWGSYEEIVKISYFAHFIQGAEQEATKHNYHLLISTYTGVEPDGKPRLPKIISKEKVDGVLVEGIDIAAFRQVARVIPAVIISNYLRLSYEENSLDDIDIVISNDEHATISSLKYLYSLGHRKVGFFCQTLRHSSFHNRFRGFNAGVKIFGMETKPEWVSESGGAQESVAKILAGEERPTALVAGNDAYALEALEWCRKNDIRVPDDVSIIGFDDIEGSVWSNPPLTTVRVMTEDMGRCAVRRLIEKIEDPSTVSTHILIGSTLVIRESCARAKE